LVRTSRRGLLRGLGSIEDRRRAARGP